jgi:serine/threonine protein kinase
MVIDFGIAQVADSVSITRTGMAIGSPGYMAPEQVTGHAGREADIFTWALIVSFAASGQAPFGTGPTVAILQRILNERPDVSAVPPRLMPLVQAALAKDPRRRPTAADLLRELSPGATAAMGAQTAVAGQTTRDVWDDGYQGATTRSLGGGSGFGGDTGPSGNTGLSGNTGSGRQRRWLGPAIAAAAVVVVLVVVGVALLANGGSGSGSGTPGAKVPGTSTTGPVLSGTKTGTSQTQPATQSQAPTTQQTPTGQNTGNTGNPGNQNGGGNGGNPGTSPSATAAASPSTSPSAATSPSTGASASTAPSTSAGTNG